MRLLITRPTANAVPLAEKLAAQGHDVLMSPVIEIYPTDKALPETADAYAALALTSANGAHALAAKADASGSHKAWLDLPAFAVGPQTAAALKAYGWQDIYEGTGDVDGLAALIADRLPDTAKPVLHVAGRDRAGNLQAALAGENIVCDLAMLYEAEAADALSPAAIAALEDRQEPVEGVLVYSQRSAKLFIALSGALAMAQKPVAYCLSPAIAEIMQSAGFATQTAASADEAAMLTLTSVAT